MEWPYWSSTTRLTKRAISLLIIIPIPNESFTLGHYSSRVLHLVKSWPLLNQEWMSKPAPVSLGIARAANLKSLIVKLFCLRQDLELCISFNKSPCFIKSRAGYRLSLEHGTYAALSEVDRRVGKSISSFTFRKATKRLTNTYYFFSLNRSWVCQSISYWDVQ